MKLDEELLAAVGIDLGRCGRSSPAGPIWKRGTRNDADPLTL
jgi:hypothetical protein